METADVLIVGGGPAGSACADRLVAAGKDVLVLDKHTFPRDKPCAGWITPQVVARLELPLGEYARDHTLQPISRFRVGRIGSHAVDVDYGEPVSYGILRSEFDAFLLRRSRTRTRLGEPVDDIQREGQRWIVNDRFAAPVLVGAGGHFCPVARRLDGGASRRNPVVAREVELHLDGSDLERCRVDPERPELYFSRDLLGYGWCFRKGGHLNIGLGRRDRQALPRHLQSFFDWLVREGRIGPVPAAGWRGHAYLVREGNGRRVAADGVVLIGDAAGLAAAASGEGILPAIVSGQLAAESILEAGLATGEDRLGRSYARRLEEELGQPPEAVRMPRSLRVTAGAVLLVWPWFARHVVLDRWFLHREAGGFSPGVARATPPSPRKASAQAVGGSTGCR